jgi:hypothetical protein
MPKNINKAGRKVKPPLHKKSPNSEASAKRRYTLRIEGVNPTLIYEDGELVATFPDRKTALDAMESFIRGHGITGVATAFVITDVTDGPIINLNLEIAVFNLEREIKRVLNEVIRPAIVSRCGTLDLSPLRVEQSDCSFKPLTALEAFDDLIADDWRAVSREVEGETISHAAKRAFDMLDHARRFITSETAMTPWGQAPELARCGEAGAMRSF